MSDHDMAFGTAGQVPSWVPEAARLYLDHTEAGAPIRALARARGCHASTILRQIRHCESRRDDLLVDDALRRLARNVAQAGDTGSPAPETAMETPTKPETDTMTEAGIRAEAPRVLRRLCEPGALLAVAAQMDNAVVVRDGASDDALRTAVVPRALAEAMALKGWIACEMPGRVSRYHITRAGRAALNLMLAEAENRASGFADAQTPFLAAQAGTRVEPEHETDRRRIRYAAAESPLIALSRRRDKDGSRFLSEDLVRAGERLREDFELSQIGPAITQNWDRFLTGPSRAHPGDGSGARGAHAARLRLEGALHDLGPGLGDIALRCCCHLEGLERAERRMGWSARSGKIVLRIALQRLKRHYDGLGEAAGMMG